MFEADRESTTPEGRRDTAHQNRQPSSSSRSDHSDLPMPPLLRLMWGLESDADPAARALLRSQPKGGGYSREILTGEAGACLAASRLLGWGYPTQSAMAGSPYDLGIDLFDGRHVRVQVKTTSAPASGAYRWAMKRGFYRSAGGTFSYRQGDFDIAALVALPINCVFFQAAPLERFSATSAILRTAGIERQSWLAALKAWELGTLKEGVDSAADGASLAQHRTHPRR